MTIFNLAEHNRQAAWKILDDTGIIQAWENIDATVNVVGSLKSGLMMKNRDIDLHIYTDQLILSESFSVIEKLAKNRSIKEIHYINQINTEEECIEWHVLYEDKEMIRWKFDMIHIRRGSKYDGFVEKVTDTIIKQLNSETKEAILRIKFDMPDNCQIPGIEIYRAVLSGGVRSYNEFMDWRKDNLFTNSMEWIP
ncbi:MAG: hypothetical protein H6Q16_387 [Bacteroidetes bacterium]|nr:hypothetical protein [Bacteroidota bacterium]